MQWVFTIAIFFILGSIAIWGHNYAVAHTHASDDVTQHLGLVSNFMLHEPGYVKLVRYLFAFLEPYALAIGEFGVRHFGRRGLFFRGPLKIVPLLLSWIAKQFFLSEVYTHEEVENLMCNLARKYTFTIASQGICPCRKAQHKYSKTLPNATDFQILAHSKIYPKIQHEYRQVPVEFVLRKTQEYDQRGLVHMMFGICGLQGSEIAICNCHASVCFPLRAAIVGLFPVVPGYRIMKVIPEKCNPACPVQTKCIKICQLRARQLGSDHKMRVDLKKCVGCGVCRNVCLNDANEFFERGKKFYRILPRSLLLKDIRVGEPVYGK